MVLSSDSLRRYVLESRQGGAARKVAQVARGALWTHFPAFVGRLIMRGLGFGDVGTRGPSVARKHQDRPAFLSSERSPKSVLVLWSGLPETDRSL